MRRLKLILAFVLCSSSIIAEAQANPRQLAEANRAAMDAYNNLEIEVAKETLERAIAGRRWLAQCRRSTPRPAR